MTRGGLAAGLAIMVWSGFIYLICKTFVISLISAQDDGGAEHPVAAQFLSGGNLDKSEKRELRSVIHADVWSRRPAVTNVQQVEPNKPIDVNQDSEEPDLLEEVRKSPEYRAAILRTRRLLSFTVPISLIGTIVPSIGFGPSQFSDRGGTVLFLNGIVCIGNAVNARTTVGLNPRWHDQDQTKPSHFAFTRTFITDIFRRSHD